jgi:hypothetical protein
MPNTTPTIDTDDHDSKATAETMPTVDTHDLKSEATAETRPGRGRPRATPQEWDDLVNRLTDRH